MTVLYEDRLAGGKHWSMVLKRGTLLTLTDLEGGANLGMMLYNPANLLERYNAPDTLKCQHTFKLGRGNCLYSDMGRIFCSIVGDSVGWHDTVCGSSTKSMVAARWGHLKYQTHRNDWTQNGYDSFLVEGGKYGLTRRDMASNVNFFSKVWADDTGAMHFDAANSVAGDRVVLRFEMDTLVLMHSCPHPMNPASDYPRRPVLYQLGRADKVAEDDYCRTFCPENGRGFENNRIYHLMTGTEA